MSNSCSGLRALVTAARAGIGKGIAAAAVDQGARIHICDIDTFFTPQDIANMALFLCSDAGRKISGQAFAIDGNTERLRI